MGVELWPDFFFWRIQKMDTVSSPAPTLVISSVDLHKKRSRENERKREREKGAGEG